MDGRACGKEPLPETSEANLIMSNKACGVEVGRRGDGEGFPRRRSSPRKIERPTGLDIRILLDIVDAKSYKRIKLSTSS